MLQRTAFRALRPTCIQRTAASSLRMPALPCSPLRYTSTSIEIDPNIADPGMNGGYPQLPPVKRQHRDPYGDWWDKQERRNFGEPVHEDNDILGIFATEDYTWTTPGWGAVLMGCFVVSFAGVCAVVYQYYPDKPSIPRRFPGGLEKELGGPNVVRALSYDDPEDKLIWSRD